MEKRSENVAPGTWNLDATQRATYFLQDMMACLDVAVVSSSITCRKMDKIRGAAWIVFDSATDVPIDFVSDFSFDFYFTVNVNGCKEVHGSISLTEEILRQIKTISTDTFKFSWQSSDSGYYMHQAKALFQSQRCRSALSKRYNDFIDHCHTTFLHMDASSQALATDCLSLGNETLDTLMNVAHEETKLQSNEIDDDENFDC